MTERNFTLAVGKTYTNRNGSNYLCKAIREPGCYIMERVSDGWTLDAHVITMYEDGTIEWDYSTGGHWTRSEALEGAGAHGKARTLAQALQNQIDSMEVDIATVDALQEIHDRK